MYKQKVLVMEIIMEQHHHDEWGKKKLAYEIQKMGEGFYYFIQFDAEPSAPAELEQRLRIMDNVLRYLCVRQEA